jgi:hypothetical protein
MGILGAGTRWIPSERWSLRLELVLHLWRLNTPPSYLELEDELGAVERREWAGTLGVMGGIHLGF